MNVLQDLVCHRIYYTNETISFWFSGGFFIKWESDFIYGQYLANIKHVSTVYTTDSDVLDLFYSAFLIYSTGMMTAIISFFLEYFIVSN